MYTDTQVIVIDGIVISYGIGKYFIKPDSSIRNPTAIELEAYRNRPEKTPKNGTNN